MSFKANINGLPARIVGLGSSDKGFDMPLTMNRDVFITCAVTGSGATQDRSRHVPRSPQEIADSAIAAARAGAAVVHCHVRDPETGARRPLAAVCRVFRHAGRRRRAPPPRSRRKQG